MEVLGSNARMLHAREDGGPWGEDTRRHESRLGRGRRLRLGLWQLREWLGLAERGDDGWGMGIGD